MRSLTRWLEYEPPGTCNGFDLGIGEGLAAIGLGGGAAAETAATGGLYSAAAASSLPSLSTIGTAAGIGGTLLSAGSAINNASYQASLAKTEAAAERQKANQDAAAAEQQQVQQLKRSDLVLSQARALAANSGTEATSPDVLTTEGRIAQQGSYNALSSLYSGQAAARAASYQSDIDLFNASRISAAAPLSAAGTVLSGIGAFARNRAMLRAYASEGAAPPFLLAGAS